MAAMECSQLAIVERALQNQRDGTKPPLESRGPDVCGTRGVGTIWPGRLLPLISAMPQLNLEGSIDML